MNEIFPIINVSGDPSEIGYQLGKKIASRIHKALDFYKILWQKGDEIVLKEVEYFKKAINDFDPKYGIEIESIAKGANVEPEWVYALNARSEILTNIAEPTDECTAISIKNYGISGQNWDWSQELELLSFIVRIKNTDTKKTILMMTEPGIIGKIGLNDNGLGVCLNFLHGGSKELRGVPVHVTLRAILDSDSIDDSMVKIENHLKGKEANILITDDNGNNLDIEFHNTRVLYPDMSSNVYIHTNHYLKEKIFDPRFDYSSSLTRYQKAMEIVENENIQTIENIKSILLNKDNELLPICRKYVPHPLIKNTGTICSIIMDHKSRDMFITRGNPFDNPFEKINVK